jgi:hypothetical protein
MIFGKHACSDIPMTTSWMQVFARISCITCGQHWLCFFCCLLGQLKICSHCNKILSLVFFFAWEGGGGGGKMPPLEVCHLRHVHSLLVPWGSPVCRFTLLQHPVLQEPLLCKLLDHVWISFRKAMIYTWHGCNCVFMLCFPVCHCRQPCGNTCWSDEREMSVWSV